MKLSRIMRSSHEGLGLLIGIQVLIWISGGLVMSALPIDKVRGEDWVAVAETPVLPAGADLKPANVIATELDLAGLESAELATWLDRPVYRLRTAETTTLVDAATGQRLAPIDAAQAREVARRDYAGPGEPETVTSVDEPRLEIRGRELPLWRVEFADSRHTTVYVSPRTGEVVGRRNTIWRVYDFFWMLHIMDYSARENFNHPWLVAAAVIAWLLATSGLYLVVTSFRRSRRQRAK